MFKKALFLAAAVVTLGLLSCQNRSNGAENIFFQSAFMMDTLIEIKVVSADRDEAQQAVKAALSRMEQIDRDMNRYNSKSLLSRINQQAGQTPLIIPPDLFAVLTHGKEWGDITQGAFDITTGAITRLWDFPGRNKPDNQTVQTNLSKVNYQLLQLDERNFSAFLPQTGMDLDLGGIAKGYAVDEAVRVLKEHGITQALVDAGGNMRALGGKDDDFPWKIGIQHPRQPKDLIGTIPLKDQAVSTSGDYERYFIQNGIRYHHIFDPQSGQPARGLISVTVISDTAETADILSTAVFVLGLKRGMNLVNSRPHTDALLITPDGKIITTPGFPLNGLDSKIAIFEHGEK
ncbi:MAG: FAD:protein FMN transferase [Candidatus Schekmanbacteria bacterium]|nr:FAD:protein FMN transferase [Candidatus Schekmanbacteria bacterium]